MVFDLHYSIFSLKPNNLYVHSSLNKILHVSEITFLYQCVKSHISSKFTGLFWGKRGPGSSVGIVTDYGLEGPGSIAGGDEIFRPASLRYNGYQSFPGVKCGRGVLLTTHPLLVPRSWKS